ncbi:hypothetical protein KI387_025841, partial [Taxus chinensis]
SAALAAECLRTTVKNAEERLSYSPCRAFEDTGKKVEKAGGTASAVSAVLAAESLRNMTKLAEEKQISDCNRTASREKEEILRSTPLAWNKLFQSPNLK